jgi:hypothetical protein
VIAAHSVVAPAWGNAEWQKRYRGQSIDGLPMATLWRTDPYVPFRWRGKYNRRVMILHNKRPVESRYQRRHEASKSRRRWQLRSASAHNIVSSRARL